MKPLSRLLRRHARQVSALSALLSLVQLAVHLAAAAQHVARQGGLL